MGYTPLFDTLTKGSLCGKWPDIGLWSVVLSMADWRGEIRATHRYISSVTGLALEDVTACMKRFCEPDPESASSNDEGRRLILLNDESGWGWKVVNIQKYRDKASGSDQIADGRNAEKVKRYKERHRQTPEDTGDTAGTPTHTADCILQTSDSDKNKSVRAPVPRGTNNPDSFSLLESIKAEYPKGMERGDHWLLAEREVGKLLDAGELPESLIAATRGYAQQQIAEGTIGTGKILRPHNFFSNGAWRGPFPLPLPRKTASAADRITWTPTE